MITINLERFDLRPGSSILDIGCGPGRHTCAATSYEGISVVGADISFDDVAEAKKRLLYKNELEGCPGDWGLITSDILDMGQEVYNGLLGNVSDFEFNNWFLDTFRSELEEQFDSIPIAQNSTA